MDDDIRVTGIDIIDPHTKLPDPISSNPPLAPVHKRLHVAAPSQPKPITFVPPAVKAMSSSEAYTSSSASYKVLILNDSFHNMLEYKTKYNKFPATYEKMVAFLNEVYNNLHYHSFRPSFWEAK
jgi:hypothetical protein